jgi:phage terminase large subunit-like protein
VSILVVPSLDEEPWPTLGGQVCAWIEANLTFGPGDLRGQPAKLDAEKRALIYRAYEVFPRGVERAGRRRFKRVAISLRKGSAKTELAAWLAAAELHPRAPVRCIGWDKAGNPLGGPVTDPFIPVVAYTEEQSEELCYGALKTILEHSKVARDFDIGMERIMRVRGDGKALAVSTAPGPRDGARTTFQVFDETHRFVLPRLRKAHQTMLANMPKRKASDAWSLETTTAAAPGENSVAEQTMHYAQAVHEGRVRDSRLFFFHRQADDGHKLDTPEDIRAAVLEASGPVASWSDVDAIVEQWNDPSADKTFLERVWLNRMVRASERAFNVARWAELARPDHVVPAGALITLGFDGSRTNDSTGIVCTEVETGFMWLEKGWEKPEGVEEWEVPQAEVEAAMEDLFDRFDVWRLYADPPYWETVTAGWAGKFGDAQWLDVAGESKTGPRVALFPTMRHRKMADATRSFANAIADGSLTHSGDPALARHVGNAHRKDLFQKDEDGAPLWVVTKDRPGSPLKIDFAVAAILSWEARRAALTEGARPDGPSIYDQRAAAGVEAIDAW